MLFFVLSGYTITSRASTENSILPIEYIANKGNYKRAFYSYEQRPLFPGGDNAFLEYVQTNLRYPKRAKRKGVEGCVLIRFYVEIDGSLSDIQIAKSPDSRLNKEALRIVKSMPKWSPGKIGGEPVRMNVIVPIYFKL